MPVIGTVTTITILGRVGLVLMIFVALLALCRPMTVAQREHCVAIMIEEGRFPLCFGMALLALNAQPSAMRIVSAMAINAGTGDLFFYTADVTALASDGLMFAAQWKARVFCVVERRDFPAAFGMAALAAGSEAFLVDIVISMTGHAIAGHPGRARRLLVAARAGQRLVCARQRKSRLLRMVEVPDTPPIRRMTAVAL